jgi:3-isopropylmalate/(R)-2-methylmalate dehydratase small subunit
MGWGIKAVISTSFADIFKGNSLKNGLLPIQVDAVTHAKLVDAVKADPKAQLSIDLAKLELTLPDGAKVKFPVDSFAQHCLLNGIDQLGYILSFDDKIKAFESSHV